MAAMEEENSINFIINNDIITITVPPEEDYSVLELRNDDEFTIKDIKSLISNGTIVLDEPLQRICRVGEEQTLVYSCDVNSNLEIYDDSASENTKNLMWTDAETRLLLGNYELYVSKVGPMKQFKNKKAMWNYLAQDINRICKVDRSSVQVENRYKTVMKRKRAVIDNNNKSGASRLEVPYEHELAKITALDDSIQPEVLRNPSGGIKLLKTINNSLPSAPSGSKSPISSIPKRKLSQENNSDLSHLQKSCTSRSKSIHDTLLKIHREKEESRERRHQQKLD